MLKDDSTVAQRTVTRGEASVDNVAIMSGLTAGEQVVTEGGDRLKDGARVQTTVDRPAAPPAGAASGERRGHRGNGERGSGRREGGAAGAGAPSGGAGAGTGAEGAGTRQRPSSSDSSTPSVPPPAPAVQPGTPPAAPGGTMR